MPTQAPDAVSTETRCRNSLWVLACLLLALVQVLWAGYQLGAGNQSIQVAFLSRLADPTLFPRDEMVNQTLARYPTLFFNLLAHATRVIEFEHLYLVLHLLAAAGLFVAVAALAGAMFGNRWAGFATLLLLLAGHHQALAEQSLYSAGFTHTWAVFAPLIAALALLYAGRYWAAFVVTGALANFHALEAGQLGIALGIWALGNSRELGWRKVAGLLVVMGALAAPTAWRMARDAQVFDAQWLQLMHVRSGLHSFPFNWWRPGNNTVPRFALFAGLAAVAWSLCPAGRHRRTTAWLMGAGALMFTAGLLFTEIWPHATVVRAQLFRGSRLLLIVLVAYIGAGIARAWLRAPDQPGWRRVLEIFSAAMTFVAVAAPPAIDLLPAALLVATLVAFINHRLHWAQALVAGAALLVSLVAWRQLQFVVPLLSPEFSLRGLLHWQGPGAAGMLVVVAAGAVWYLAGQPLTWGRSLLVAGTGAATLAVMAAGARERLLTPPAADANWLAAQVWTRENTPVDALLLTPAQMGGFRMLSQRSIVGEWPDGTQLYFSAGFAPTWWERMNMVQPGLRIAADGRRLLVRGKPLGQMEDEAVLALARQFGATHVVLPTDETRRLVLLYRNPEWSVYLPRFASAEMQEGALLAKQTKFLKEVAGPAIERNRKSAARLQIMGADGRPVYDASYRIAQTNSAFAFGVSWPGTPSAAQEQRLRDLFNHVVIGEPAWWATIEPVADTRDMSGLDRALAWSSERGLSAEVNSLTGFPPLWVAQRGTSNFVDRLAAHLEELLDRHGERAAYWRFTDQGVLLNEALLRADQWLDKVNACAVGVGDPGRFLAPTDKTEWLATGLTAARQLREAGVNVRYIALHGRQPWGLWADAATIYEVLDLCAKENLRVHVTAFGVPDEGWIEGPVRQGQWDAKLQAEYCRVFYTICYSHPAVESVSYAELGPITSVPGIGLLGPDEKPRPAYAALRELIRRQWRTRLNGKLPLDGRVAFQGFHGDYELTVTLKGNVQLRAPFRVAPGQSNHWRFAVDEVNRRLEVVE